MVYHLFQNYKILYLLHPFQFSLTMKLSLCVSSTSIDNLMDDRKLTNAAFILISEVFGHGLKISIVYEFIAYTSPYVISLLAAILLRKDFLYTDKSSISIICMFLQFCLLKILMVKSFDQSKPLFFYITVKNYEK